MAGYGGWAVALNGVVLAQGCAHADSCFEDEKVFDVLDAPPEGLGLPGLRTEDVTFAQRDGVQHYSDWYEARILTLTGTFMDDESCTKCGQARQQVADAVQAWKRGCCDTELVIFTPCTEEVYDEFPHPQLFSDRTNLASFHPDGSDYLDGCDGLGWTQRRSFADGTGSYSLYEETEDLPADLGVPQMVARKTWATGMLRYSTCYPDCYDGAGNKACYDHVTPGDNLGGGFLLSCTGTNGYTVTPGEQYTLSGYLRASASGWNLQAVVTFYDENGLGVSATAGDVVVSVADQWQRLSVTATVPAGAVTASFLLDTISGGTLIQPGDTLDGAAALIEKTGTLAGYFDGSFSDSDDPQLGGAKVEYEWTGDPDESTSTERVWEYVAGPNRQLNGPFGMVGRPRVFQHNWLNRTQSIAEFVARFDGVDQRFYILDECGTPGHADCATLDPGAEILASCYGETGVCYPECYDTPIEGSKSVPATQINVLGTETTPPTIVLTGPLHNPRVEDLTTNTSLVFRGTIDAGDPPVEVYVDEGTAYQNGESVSHLLSGFGEGWFAPGEHQIRLITASPADTGTAEVCWRPAVLVA